MTRLILVFFLLFSGLTISSSLYGQNGVSDAEEKAARQEMLNGYPKSKYYHLNIQIPDEVLNSDKKTDRINVFIHHKIVDFEKTKLKPLSSLPKAEMESLLKSFEDEAYATLYPPAEKDQEAVPDPPAEKPSIIEGK